MSEVDPPLSPPLSTFRPHPSLEVALRRWPRVTATLLSFVAAFGQRSACAQQIGSIDENNTDVVYWDPNIDRDNDQLLTIRRVDCERDVQLVIRLDVPVPSAQVDLEVWAGRNGACELDDDRRGTAVESDPPDCWRVYQTRNSDDRVYIEIPVRNIVARELNGALSSNLDESVCFGGTDQGITLTVMHENGGSVAGNYETFEIRIDMIGPSPPESVTAGPGEGRLYVNWTGTAADDTERFLLFCAPIDAGLSSDAGVAADSGTATVGTTAAAAGSEEQSLPTSATACSSSLLIPGETLDAEVEREYRCGEVGRISTRGVAKGLENGRVYAVGVVAVDNAGNLGRVSELACGTPEVISEFYETYRERGGPGGGGFCSMGLSAQSSGFFWAFLGSTGLALLRRRRLSSTRQREDAIQ